MINKNKLIAEFDGKKYLPIREGDSFLIIESDTGLKQAKYNTSWNWLMPVWHKFRDLKFDEETTKKLHNNYTARLAQDLAYGTIDEFHHNITIAIKWYNQIKK